jgi:hypothetical protein
MPNETKAKKIARKQARSLDLENAATVVDILEQRAAQKLASKVGFWQRVKAWYKRRGVQS